MPSSAAYNSATKKRKASTDYEKGELFYEQLKKKEDAKKANAVVARRKVTVKRGNAVAANANASTTATATTTPTRSSSRSSLPAAASPANTPIRRSAARKSAGSAAVKSSSAKYSPRKSVLRSTVSAADGKHKHGDDSSENDDEVLIDVQDNDDDDEEISSEGEEEEASAKPPAKRRRIDSPPRTTRHSVGAPATTHPSSSASFQSNAAAVSSGSGGNSSQTRSASLRRPSLSLTADQAVVTTATTRADRAAAEQRAADYQAAKQWATTNTGAAVKTPPRGWAAAAATAATTTSVGKPYEKPPFGSPLPSSGGSSGGSRRRGCARLGQQQQPQQRQKPPPTQHHVEDSEDDQYEAAATHAVAYQPVQHVPEPEVMEIPDDRGSGLRVALVGLLGVVAVSVLIAAVAVGGNAPLFEFLDVRGVLIPAFVKTVAPTLHLQQHQQPCFADYPVRNNVEFEDEDDSVGVVLPSHCKGGDVERTPCPVGGHCAGGHLQSCYDSHYQVSESDSACVLSEASQRSMEALTDLLEKYSAQQICGAGGGKAGKNPFYVQRDVETNRPLFLYQSLTDVLQIPYDPQLLRAAVYDEGSDDLQLFIVDKRDDGSVLIGLHPSKEIPLPAACYAKKLTTSFVTGALVLLWTVTVVVGSWIWSFFLESPVEAVVTTVIGFVVLTTMHFVKSKSRKRRQLELEVINLRERVYSELSKDAGQTVLANIICNRIAWKDHPSSRKARDRLSRVIFPMVVRDLDSDRRVDKTWTASSNGTQELVWQWLDQPHESIVRFREGGGQ